MYEQKKHVRLRNPVLLAVIEGQRYKYKIDQGLWIAYIHKCIYAMLKLPLVTKNRVWPERYGIASAKLKVTVVLPHSSPTGPRRPVTATRSDSFIVDVTKWSKS